MLLLTQDLILCPRPSSLYNLGWPQTHNNPLASILGEQACAITASSKHLDVTKETTGDQDACEPFAGSKLH